MLGQTVEHLFERCELGRGEDCGCRAVGVGRRTFDLVANSEASPDPNVTAYSPRELGLRRDANASRPSSASCDVVA